MSLVPARLRCLTGVVATAALVGFISVSPLAGQKLAAAAPTPRAAAAAARPAPGGLRAGIRVHGKWTIVVRNPNGTIAAKREFENTLTVNGLNSMAAVLSGGQLGGPWAIVLGSPTPPGPCVAGITLPGVTQDGSVVALTDSCLIVDGTRVYQRALGCGSFPAGACASTLATSLTVVGVLNLSSGAEVNLHGVQLTGFVPVSQAGTIGVVATDWFNCDAALGTGACGGPGANYMSTYAPLAFTEAQPPGAPIAVIAGQTVQVTVVISFS